MQEDKHHSRNATQRGNNNAVAVVWLTWLACCCGDFHVLMFRGSFFAFFFASVAILRVLMVLWVLLHAYMCLKALRL